MKKVILCLLIFLTIAICLFNLDGLHITIEKSLDMFIDNILPSLLPFMFLTNLFILTGIGELLSFFLQYISIPLFGVNGNAAFAIICSILGGFPGGAIVINSLYEQKRICIEEKQRIINFCSFVSPAFLYGSIGSYIVDKELLNLMYFSILLCGFILLIITNQKSNIAITPINLFTTETNKKIKDLTFSNFLQNVILKSLKNIATILGIVLFFGIVNFILQQLFSDSIAIYLTGIFEFSLPSIQLVANSNNNLTLCYVVFLLSWSGLSVIFQILAFCKEKDFSTKSFIISRLVHAIMASGLFYYLIAFR